MTSAEKVRVFEMGPRDGLQNEKQQIATADKIRLVDQLSQCGFSHIEVTSFVSPKWVPQLADAAEVMSGIKRGQGISYAVLTPNLRGYEGARAAKASEVAIFASASESFSQKNINCSISESIDRFVPLMEAAKRDGMPVRGYVSCVTDCPYEGSVAPKQVADVARSLEQLGCYEISLGDTIGKGTPQTISNMLDAVLESIPAKHLAGHYHDTNGQALANIQVSLNRGLRTFDAAVGGLGGCPYAPGAKGNVDTRAVVTLLHELGYETGINVTLLEEAAEFALSLRK